MGSSEAAVNLWVAQQRGTGQDTAKNTLFLWRQCFDVTLQGGNAEQYHAEN